MARPRKSAAAVGQRLELSDRQWEAIEPLLPGKVGDPGRTAADNRSFVNAVIWVLGQTDAQWNRLPAHYGSYKSVHKRYRRWEERGIWAKVFARLNRDLDTGLPCVGATPAAHARSESAFDLA